MKEKQTKPEVDKSKYFHRAIVYTRREDKVVLVDHHDATASPPLDPWLGRVYLLADGQHTVQELIDLTIKHSDGTPNEEVIRTIDSVVGRLLEAEVIKLSQAPMKLPYYLATSADEQDSDLAKKLMLEDGYMQTKN